MVTESIYQIYIPNVPNNLDEVKLQYDVIRIVHTCNKKPLVTENLIKLLEELKNSHGLIQIELPVLSQELILNIKDNIKLLNSYKKIEFVINCFGALNLINKIDKKIVLGRMFNKTMNKYPDNSRFPIGRLVNFDIILSINRINKMALPYLGINFINYLEKHNVVGLDLDLPNYKLLTQDDLRLIKNFKIYLHNDLFFAAHGDQCIYELLNKKCDFSKCSLLEYKYSYFSFDNKSVNDYQTEYFPIGQNLYMRECNEI